MKNEYEIGGKVEYPSSGACRKRNGGDSEQTSSFIFRFCILSLKVFSAVCGPIWLNFGGLLTTSGPQKDVSDISFDGKIQKP